MLDLTKFGLITSSTALSLHLKVVGKTFQLCFLPVVSSSCFNLGNTFLESRIERKEFITKLFFIIFFITSKKIRIKMDSFFSYAALFHF